MASKLRRTSFLTRIGAGAGIGALAIVTGACSPGEGGTDSDMGATSDPSAGERAAPATDSDRAAATDSDPAAPAAPAVDGDAAPAAESGEAPPAE